MSRALVLLAGLAVAGCASHAAVNGPPFRLTTSLDREVYKTGDPVTVTVAIENTGTDAIDVPRFDKSSARFMIGEKGLNVRIHREPVHSRAVRSNPRRIEPGASTSRRFVFVNVTQAAGEFAERHTVLNCSPSATRSRLRMMAGGKAEITVDEAEEVAGALLGALGWPPGLQSCGPPWGRCASSTEGPLRRRPRE